MAVEARKLAAKSPVAQGLDRQDVVVVLPDVLHPAVAGLGVAGKGGDGGRAATRQRDMDMVEGQQEKGGNGEHIVKGRGEPRTVGALFVLWYSVEEEARRYKSGKDGWCPRQESNLRLQD